MIEVHIFGEVGSPILLQVFGVVVHNRLLSFLLCATQSTFVVPVSP